MTQQTVDKLRTPTGRMRRSFVAQLRQTTPYYPALSRYGVARSIASNILMVQLEYWFDQMLNEGKTYFYKFIEPAKKAYGYKSGDSWCEELAITPAVFRAAFDEIGVAYKSKGAFDKKFKQDPQSVFFKEVTTKKRSIKGKHSCKSLTETKEMLYASYHDRMRYRVYFFRNDVAIDAALSQIISSDPTTVNLYRKQEADKQLQAKVRAKQQEKEFVTAITKSDHSKVNPLERIYSKDGQSQLDYQKINNQETTNYLGIQGASVPLAPEPESGENISFSWLDQEGTNSDLVASPENTPRTEEKGFSSKRLLKLAAEVYFQRSTSSQVTTDDQWIIHKAVAVAELFLAEYRFRYQKFHDVRKNNTLRRAFEEIFEFLYTEDISHFKAGNEIPLDEYKQMIMRYFQWVDSERKPARLEHFCNYQVMTYRYKEVFDGGTAWYKL